MTSRKQLNEAIERLEGRLDKMYEDRLDGVITDEYYKRKADDYKREKRSILKQLENLEDRVDNYYEVGLEIHRLAFNAREDKPHPKKNVTYCPVFSLIWNSRLNAKYT